MRPLSRRGAAVAPLCLAPLCLAALLCAPHALASDGDITTEVEARLAIGLGTAGIRQADIMIEPSWERDLSDTVTAVVSARLRAEGADTLTPGRPDTTGYSSINGILKLGDRATAELRDAYLDITAGDTFIRLGKQQIVWGELEGFRVLDVVNPQNFREFILDDFDDARIGLWAASVEMPLSSGDFGDWSLQAIWVPDTTVSDIPLPGAEFAPQASRFRFGVPADAAPALPISSDIPNDPFSDGAFGGRLTGLVDGWDLSAVAYSGLDPEPVGEVRSVDGVPTLVRRHERRTVVGGSAVNTFGRVTARLEASLQPDRALTTRNARGIQPARADQATVALALDMRAPGDVFLSLQGIYDRVTGAPAGLVRPRSDVLTSVFALRRFQQDDLTVSVRWLADDVGANGVLSPKIAYRVNDAVSIEAGLDIFHGDRDSTFGQFDTRDRISFALRRVY